MFTFRYPITRWPQGAAMHDLRQSNPLISVLFVWPSCCGLGATQGRFYEDLCPFEVLAGHGGFRRRDEMRNEFRGKVEGGLDCEKGVQAIWSSSDDGWAVAGSCSEEEWVITIKLRSCRKWPPVAPIAAITADNTLDKETPNICVCVFMHVRECACACLPLFSVCFFTTCGLQTSVPYCSFHPEVSVCCRGVSGRWALYWWSSLFLLAWRCLRAEALLGECGCSRDVFTPALADCRPNENQIWELSWFGVWYWHPSPLGSTGL